MKSLTSRTVFMSRWDWNRQSLWVESGKQWKTVLLVNTSCKKMISLLWELLPFIITNNIGRILISLFLKDLIPRANTTWPQMAKKDLHLLTTPIWKEKEYVQEGKWLKQYLPSWFSLYLGNLILNLKIRECWQTSQCGMSLLLGNL